MKKAIYLLISLVCVVCLFGCVEQPTTPKTLYILGYEYDFSSYSLKVLDDKETEQFIITYNAINEENQDFVFNFRFSHSAYINLENSNEFSYSDNLGSDIMFDDEGEYKFTGDRTFYVSYKNASAEVKELVVLDDYILTIDTKTFISQ